MDSYTDLRYVTLHGRFTRGGATEPAVGSVLVGMATATADTSVDIVLSTQPLRLELLDGEFSALVPATELEPAPLVEVTLLLDGTRPALWQFPVVTASDDVDLSDLPVLAYPGVGGWTLQVGWADGPSVPVFPSVPAPVLPPGEDTLPRAMLTGRLTRGSGDPATGKVRVGVLVPVQAGDEVITHQVDLITLQNGMFTCPVPVPATPGDPDVWIEVQALLEGTRPFQLVFKLPAGTTQIDLSEVDPMPVRPTDEPVVPWSVVGEPGGVAPLDVLGKVPAQFLPAAVGGYVSWFEGDGPPPLVIPGAAPGDMYYDRIGNTFSQLQ